MAMMQGMRRSFPALLIVLGTLMPAIAAEAPAPPSSEVQTIAAFETRVKDYAALHRKLESKLPKLPRQPTPEQADQHQRALAELIQSARQNAKPGAIFTPEAQALVRRITGEVLSGPDGKTLKASIMDENPGVPKLVLNQRYPSSAPLSTMPPQLLAKLPKLPEELEYHFIGPRLILLDIHADIIVDWAEDILPR